MSRFSLPMRVYYEDTDAGGIVYYGAYLRFLERARTEWLRTLGLDHRALGVDHGVMFTVSRLEIEYLRPARLDDAIRVTVALERAGRASLKLAQCVHRDSVELCRARVRIACVDAATCKPRPLPGVVTSELDP